MLWKTAVDVAIPLVSEVCPILDCGRLRVGSLCKGHLCSPEYILKCRLKMDREGLKRAVGSDDVIIHV